MLNRSGVPYTVGGTYAFQYCAGISRSTRDFDIFVRPRDVPTRDSKVCQGPLLSRAQYLVDVDEWGYEDARLIPRGSMTEQQIAEWTAAIDRS